MTLQETKIGINEDLHQRLQAFVIEKEPFARNVVRKLKPDELLLEDLAERIDRLLSEEGDGEKETLPFQRISGRLRVASQKLADDIQGFFAREAIKMSLTREEKRWLYEGMVLTRAVDNALKKMFMSGEIKYEEQSFQGKGFRSLGQEAIYGAALKLKRGPFFDGNRQMKPYEGDFVGPIIRDLGLYLAFSHNDVEAALNAQAGKSGKPLNGRDLHFGDFSLGVLVAAAPLAISTCTLIGMALAFKEKSSDRVAVSFIGDGGTSLGEWHEAINFASSKKLPMVFCIENNQIALSTAKKEQSLARAFADKGLGYGIASLSVDGTNVEEVACAFAWARQQALMKGPILLELISMRMCGHAHHDDMLYLGHEPEISLSFCAPKKSGYIDHSLYEQWKQKDPLSSYEEQLLKENVLSKAELNKIKKEALAKCEKALENLKKRPWASKEEALAEPVFKKNYSFRMRKKLEVTPQPPFVKSGATYLEAICEGIRQSFIEYPQARVLGEDVAPPYGNAFMMFKSLFSKFGDRFINTPISESAIIGASVGMALEGMLPIAEMQFNDFAACGFNQLVNNAAKLFFRTGLSVPMVLRMPYGGLRRAGPFHSQDTSSWFYRVSGLKIVAPSTPHDAMALMLLAVSDPDPVLYYEHIALYRRPELRQDLSLQPILFSLGEAALRQVGTDLTLISYGAYVHKALALAQALWHEEEKSACVIDLRSLCPLDFALIEACIKNTGRVLLLGEDSARGNVLESIASLIAANCFHHLDAPPKVLGSLFTPVPYAPPLEDAYLLSEKTMLKEALALLAY